MVQTVEDNRDSEKEMDSGRKKQENRMQRVCVCVCERVLGTRYERDDETRLNQMKNGRKRLRDYIRNPLHNAVGYLVYPSHRLTILYNMHDCC